jgi:NADPH:quinone reductase-like Zn-dependent oxidoreductase
MNWSDLLQIQRIYSRTALSFVPGFEGVGSVVAAGNGVTNIRSGDRVLPLRGQGTWQDYVLAPAEFSVPVPDAFDDLTAAQLYINPMTAWLMLREVAGLGPGDVIAVNAAGSALARVLFSFAAERALKSIAIVRNARHTKSLEDLGVCDIIDTSRSDLILKIAALTNGRGVAAAFDAIGADLAQYQSRVAGRTVAAIAGVVAIIVGKWHGFLATAVAALVYLVMRRVFLRRLGGFTGDCAGALIEIVEALSLVVRPSPMV